MDFLDTGFPDHLLSSLWIFWIPDFRIIDYLVYGFSGLWIFRFAYYSVYGLFGLWIIRIMDITFKNYPVEGLSGLCFIRFVDCGGLGY